MQNIHVKRYRPELKDWQGTISPEDGSWVVFIDADGEPFFYRRVESETSEGRVEESYVDVEIPCAPLVEAPDALPPADLRTPEESPFDYEVVPSEGPGLSSTGFFAKLNCRQVACYGETEHEAVRNLINYVAKLCTAGCLDHTGNPSHGNPRRYKYVFGKEPPLEASEPKGP